MSRMASSVLALLAVAAAIECPDETWLKMNGKCYSKQASGTHAKCATLCGANSSLIHITSKLENDFASFVAGGKPASSSIPGGIASPTATVLAARRRRASMTALWRLMRPRERSIGSM